MPKYANNERIIGRFFIGNVFISADKSFSEQTKIQQKNISPEKAQK